MNQTTFLEASANQVLRNAGKWLRTTLAITEEAEITRWLPARVGPTVLDSPVEPTVAVIAVWGTRDGPLGAGIVLEPTEDIQRAVRLIDPTKRAEYVAALTPVIEAAEAARNGKDQAAVDAIVAAIEAAVNAGGKA